MLRGQAEGHVRHKSACGEFFDEVHDMTGSSFVRLLHRRGKCSASAIVVGVVYLEKLRELDDSVVLTVHNFRRLLLVPVMVAAKFLDDRCACNREWASITGIDLAELNRLEVDFLCQMGFSLNITREEYEWYAEELRLRAVPETVQCKSPPPLVLSESSPLPSAGVCRGPASHLSSLSRSVGSSCLLLVTCCCF